jgi:hypothetical protein
MTYTELQNEPSGTYLIITFNESVFKFYPNQIGEAFWQFLTENAIITKGNDKDI